LTIFDAVLAWLTYRGYRKQLALARRLGRIERRSDDGLHAGRPGVISGRRSGLRERRGMRGPISGPSPVKGVRDADGDS
jgi:hypothetical protein